MPSRLEHRLYYKKIDRLKIFFVVCVIVISRAQAMYVIYCTEARGREAARGLSAINPIHPECA